MTCSCKTERALYAKTEDYADLPHCIDCKYESGAHNCSRFTSMVSGLKTVLTCEDARTSESLCGFVGRYWVKREG